MVKKSTPKKVTKELTLKQQLEFHERVSALALYTNATIVDRNKQTTTLHVVLKVKTGKNSKYFDMNIVCDYSILKVKLRRGTLVEKGKDMFRAACDDFRAEHNLDTVTITTAYGDRYEYKNHVTRLYNARSKMWETV